MYKKVALIVFLVLALALAAAAAVHYRAEPEPVGPAKLNVSASFYPLAYLAEQVGGDKVTVTSVIPNGLEPHDFEPTPQNVIALRSTKAFIYNGNGLDTWAERLRPELEDAGVTVVAASQAVTALSTVEESIIVAGEEPGHDEEGEEHHDHGAFDPHIWLDPIRARQISELIRDTYITLDPVNADYYRTRSAELATRLGVLHDEYEKTLANCSTRNVVVSHDAFNYLAKRYNLTMQAIAGLSPDAEPSIKRLAELTDFVKKEKVSTIFFETLVSKNLANTLAKETGVVTAVLNPIEGLTADDLAANRNYETIMRDNLQALSQALVCQ